MIIARSPLRITLGGGGTDLPSYFEKNGGYLIAAAINKYVYATVMRPFTPGIFLKYSRIEQIEKISEIQHPIIREVLNELNLRTPQREITTLADIPSGTGLGSSGSFTTALIKALFTHYKRSIDPKELAELACKIEISKLNEPIGKQDQYIASCGGITQLYFKKDGTVKVEQLPISIKTQHDLEDNLLLFFTGVSRSASLILRDQNSRSLKNEKEMIENLDFIKKIGYKCKDALVLGNMVEFGNLMNEHWEYKKLRSKGISDAQIDKIYSSALKNGALGGKIVGAGGGGFLLFYASDKEKLRAYMQDLKLEEVRFNFDFEGTKVIMS